MLGLAAWGYRQGTPELDIANAVRAGDLARVTAILERDPALARAKVYALAYERVDTKRFGKRIWGQRYLIHDACGRTVRGVFARLPYKSTCQARRR